MIYLIGIFVYLFVLTGISIYKSRQAKTQSDFALVVVSLLTPKHKTAAEG